MEFQQILFLVILAVTLGLFISEKLRIDLVALLALLALTLTGILGPKDALAGFASVPAIIVAAVFVLSAGLSATGITDRMLQGMPTAGAAMMRFHQWIDHVWPAGEPLTIIAHNAQFDVSFLDAAERVYDPTSPVFDCKWACTKEMSWELNPQKRHHRVADLIVDYHIGDVEEHRALSDAIQEQMLYQALCAEATRRGKWNERED